MTKKNLWIVAGLMLMTGLVLYASCHRFLCSREIGVSEKSMPSPVVVEQYARKTVYGELGGVPVEIPSHFAEYVEHDGDPGWSEKIAEPQSARERGAKLASFGFSIRYPDMVGKDSPAHLADYKNRKIGSTTWIRVGINSARMYSGSGSIGRLAENSLNRMLSTSSRPPYQYKKLSYKQYGLNVYVPKGFDAENKVPYRKHKDAEDVFVGVDSDGGVISYIKCSNRPIESAPCEHHFDLEPKMHADVSVSYRRGMLSEWREIQESVTRVVLNFSVTKNN